MHLGWWKCGWASTHEIPECVSKVLWVDLVKQRLLNILRYFCTFIMSNVRLFSGKFVYQTGAPVFTTPERTLDGSQSKITRTHLTLMSKFAQMTRFCIFANYSLQINKQTNDKHHHKKTKACFLHANTQRTNGSRRLKLKISAHWASIIHQHVKLKCSLFILYSCFSFLHGSTSSKQWSSPLNESVPFTIIKAN